MCHRCINGDNDIERIDYMGGIEEVMLRGLLDGYARATKFGDGIVNLQRNPETSGNIEKRHQCIDRNGPFLVAFLGWIAGPCNSNPEGLPIRSIQYCGSESYG